MPVLFQNKCLTLIKKEYWYGQKEVKREIQIFLAKLFDTGWLKYTHIIFSTWYSEICYKILIEKRKYKGSIFHLLVFHPASTLNSVLIVYYNFWIICTWIIFCKLWLFVFSLYFNTISLPLYFSVYYMGNDIKQPYIARDMKKMFLLTLAVIH